MKAIQAVFADGRIRSWPERSAIEYFGENVQPEFEVRFDDVSNGVYIEGRHWEAVPADSSDMFSRPDQRGSSCELVNDFFIQIITAEELGDIVEVRYGAELVLVRIDEELVNLGKISTLQTLYMSEKRDSALKLLIAELYEIITAQNSLDDGSGPPNPIAAQLGVSQRLLDSSLAFRADVLAASSDAEIGGFEGEIEDEGVPFDFS